MKAFCEDFAREHKYMLLICIVTERFIKGGGLYEGDGNTITKRNNRIVSMALERMAYLSFSKCLNHEKYSLLTNKCT